MRFPPVDRSDTEIRPLRESDIESFYETFAIVVRERRYLAFEEPPSLEQVREFCRRTLAAGYPMLVAVGDERVVGWCDVTPPGRDVMAHVGVLGIGLHPAWRGKGVGEPLMRRAIAAAWDFGFAKIELGVFVHNARAHALYRRLGFSVEGVRRRHVRIDGHYFDELMMGLMAPAIGD